MRFVPSCYIYKKRREMHYERNIGVRLRHHCDSGVLHIWMYICSLRYTARKAHAPYYSVICGLCGSTIFFHIISYMTRHSETVVEHIICVLIYSTTLVWIISHIRRIQRHIIIDVLRPLCKVPIILVRFYFTCIQPYTAWEWFHYHSTRVPTFRFVLSKCCIWRIFRSTKHLP